MLESLLGRRDGEKLDFSLWAVLPFSHPLAGSSQNPRRGSISGRQPDFISFTFVTDGTFRLESGADSLPLPQLGLQVHCHAQ
jgi:hypothetical protein